VEGAQDLYFTLKNMYFTLEDYGEILRLYNEESRDQTPAKGAPRNELLKKVACRWMHQPIESGE